MAHSTGPIASVNTRGVTGQNGTDAAVDGVGVPWREEVPLNSVVGSRPMTVTRLTGLVELRVIPAVMEKYWHADCR